MNQHSKRGGQANGNSVDEVRRGATRPAVVVAIVLCVGFAVAMVAIWPFRKPRSHQEMQTQPKAAVQTEIPKREAGSPASVSDRAVPLEPSTSTPVPPKLPAQPPAERYSSIIKLDFFGVPIQLRYAPLHAKLGAPLTEAPTTPASSAAWTNVTSSMVELLSALDD